MKNKILTVFAVILAFVAGGELTYLVFVKNTNSYSNGNEESIMYNSCSNCMSGTMIVENGGIKETVNKVYDAIVMVKNYIGVSLSGSGSGFVYKIDDDYGYLLTNEHVIDDATRITIVSTSNEEVEAELLGKDKYLDVAVLRIPKEKVIAVAKIGSSEELELGDTIVTIGTPVDEEYYNTVTGGYVSGLDRKVTVSVDSKNDWVQDVIQIDAPINPGNSGGALVNVNGEVVGITSMKFVNSNIEGMGFAIKIDDIMKHIDELEKGKAIERPLIGISYANVSDSNTLARYNISIDSSIESGIVIISVYDDTGAAKAELKAGDVITKLDGETVKNVAHLKYLLYKHKAGDTIKISYIRGKTEYTADVTLTEKEN